MAEGRNVNVGVIAVCDVMEQILLLKEINLSEVSIIYLFDLKTATKDPSEIVT
jgi:hypothetical protein